MAVAANPLAESRTGTIIVAVRTVSVTQVNVPCEEVRLEGAINDVSGSCPNRTFTVSGTIVVTNAATVYQGNRSCSDIRNGASAWIRGVRQANGHILATRIDRFDSERDDFLDIRQEEASRSSRDGSWRAAHRAARRDAAWLADAPTPTTTLAADFARSARLLKVDLPVAVTSAPNATATSRSASSLATTTSRWTIAKLMSANYIGPPEATPTMVGRADIGLDSEARRSAGHGFVNGAGERAAVPVARSSLSPAR